MLKDAILPAGFVHMLTEVLLVVRVILRPHREPTSYIAWILG